MSPRVLAGSFSAGILAVLLSCGGLPGYAPDILAVRPIADPALVVRYSTDPCDTLSHVRASEEWDRIRLIVRLENDSDPCTAEAVVKEVIVPLEHPLGDRIVVNEVGGIVRVDET